MSALTKQINYRVQVKHDPVDPTFWLADVENLAGGHAAALTLADLEAQVRDVIALLTGLDDADDELLHLDWHTVAGDPIAVPEAPPTHVTLGTAADPSSGLGLD